MLCLAAGVVLTGLSIWQQIPVAVLPLAVGIGVAAHVVGDCLTEEGCPLLWPIPWRVSVLPLETEGLIERYVVGPVLGLAAVVLVWQLSDQSALAPFAPAACTVPVGDIPSDDGEEDQCAGLVHGGARPAAAAPDWTSTTPVDVAIGR